MCRELLIALVLLGISEGAHSVESGELTMTIVSAEQKTHDRVVAWVNDTPIYQPDVYFHVAVRSRECVRGRIRARQPVGNSASILEARS